MRRERHSLDRFRVERKSIAPGATITLELPYPVSVNEAFRNVEGVGRVKTEKYAAWRREAAQLIMIQRVRCAIGQVEVTMTFEDRKGTRDADNLIKAVLDCLVENGIIASDSSKTVRRIIAQWGSCVGALVQIASLEQPREAA